MGGRTNRAVGLFLGLMLAVFAGSVFAPAAEPVVIELGGETVTRGEFNRLFDVALRLLAAQQGIALGDQKPEQLAALRRQFLNQRANEMSLVRAADRRNIHVSDDDVREQFEDSLASMNADTGTRVDETILRQLLKDKRQVALLTEQLLAEIEVRPGEVLVMHHDLQDQLATPEQICLRHIVVAEESTARELLTELRQGADFAALARQYSTERRSAGNGGDVGCFAREYLIPNSEFERAAYNAKVDALTGPVSSEAGYHLVIVYERKPPQVPTLNEVYNDLEKEIRHEKLPGKLAAIRDASGVVTYPDQLDP